MFVDRVRVKFKAGRGGNGKVSFDIMKKPSGGIGGDGGSIYLVGDTNVYDLHGIKPRSVIEGFPGEHGGKNNSSGERGREVVIRVPLTTHVRDLQGNLIATRDKRGEKVMIAKGGRGGLGNFFYKGKGVERSGKADPGRPGQSLDVTLNLELYSDILLVGFPNAGKSSLLNEISNASSKVANYAFTTLNPELGIVNGLTVMDLPGLIEGTHEGRGLGTSFVKHTKSAKLLAHLVSLESEDVEAEYKKIRTELENINPKLAAKPEIILLSKSDLATEEKIKQSIKSLKKYKREIYVCSAYDYDSLESLKNVFTTFIAQKMV